MDVAHRSVRGGILLFCFAAAMAAGGDPLPARVKGLARAEISWRSVGPGGGGWIQSIAWSRHAAERLLVGCDVGGFYLSSDEGRTYEMRNRGLANFFIETMAEHPTRPETILAGTLGGVCKTTDAGRTWRMCRTGFPPIAPYRHSAPISKIVYSPANADHVYAAVGRPRTAEARKAQIWKSVDGGESWRMIVESGLPEESSVLDLSPDPSAPEELLASTERGVWLSEDGGATWRLSSEGLPSTLRTRRLARAPSRPSTVYVSLRQKGGEAPWSAGVYRSDDGGRTWQPRHETLRKVVGKPGSDDNLCTWTDCLAVDPLDPETVWTAGATWWYQGIFKSTDGGHTWRNVFPLDERGWIDFWGVPATCFSLSARDRRRAAFGTAGAVFVTTDGGASWRQRYSQPRTDGRLKGTGLEVTCLHTVVPSRHLPGKFFLGYFDIGLLVTTDRGDSLTRTMAGVPAKFSNSCFALAEAPDDPLRVWACFGTWGGRQTGCLAQSADGGASWQACTNAVSGWPGGRVRDLIVTGTQGRYGLLTAGDDGLMASRDGGRTWRREDDGFPQASRVRRLALAGDALWAGVEGTAREPSSLYRRTRAEGWRPATPPGVAIGHFESLSVEGERVLFTARARWMPAERKMREGGAWASVDGGRTWRKVFDDRFCTAALVSRGEMFISLADHPFHDESVGGGVLWSRDEGATWRVLDGPGLQNWNVTALARNPFAPEEIWLGTGGNSVFVGSLPAGADRGGKKEAER
jgi:photosystem II stability/assembly factor-like uncharacterized protein